MHITVFNNYCFIQTIENLSNNDLLCHIPAISLIIFKIIMLYFCLNTY